MADAPASTEAPPASATPQAPEAPETPELGESGKAALDAERKARRDAEKAAKTATAELEKLRAEKSTDEEKALLAAKAEGRSEALQETGVKLVDAEVRAATAGRNVDADALLEGLDRTKFLDDQGDPDREQIKAWVDRVAPAQQPGGFQVPDLSQGTRTPALALGSDPLTETLKNMVGR